MPIAAARVADKATGLQVLASDVVRRFAAGTGARFMDAGEHKGIAEAIRVWELGWASVQHAEG